MATDAWTFAERPRMGEGGAFHPQKTAAEGVQSIARAVTLLNVLSSVGRAGAPLARIVTLSRLSKATAHRILCALLAEGYVEQDAGSHNYRLGAQVAVLNAVMGRQFDLRLVAGQVLDKLAALTGDAVYFCVRTHYDGLCLDLREGEHRLPLLRIKPDECWPLGVGAFSIALLAFLPDAEVDAIIERNAQFLAAQKDITTASIREQVERTRERGYAASRNLGNQGMAAAAVPVFDPHWRPLASLCVTTTLERFSPEREQELLNLLWQESRRITREWCELGGIARNLTWRKGLGSTI